MSAILVYIKHIMWPLRHAHESTKTYAYRQTRALKTQTIKRRQT